MFDHIKFNPDSFTLVLLDQRKLPGKIEYFQSGDYRDVVAAIKKMVLRGAPLIGITAAYACVLAANEARKKNLSHSWLISAFAEIEKARPTAVNLVWAVEQMRALLDTQETISPEVFLDQAVKLHEEDISICRKLGFQGAKLIQDGDTVLTHCNAGALATAGYGTALGVIRAAREQGKEVKVIADETRPLLQGARLTAWELEQDGIPVTIACDNACAMLVKKNLVNLVITGADRVALNGDTANKIGTLGVAIISQYFNIPFYIACPVSTIDPSCRSGEQIPVEIRDASEVLEIGAQPIAPKNAGAMNFAFDVTPASLITGIITEKGILYPPYEKSISSVLDRNENA